MRLGRKRPGFPHIMIRKNLSATTQLIASTIWKLHMGACRRNIRASWKRKKMPPGMGHSGPARILQVSNRCRIRGVSDTAGQVAIPTMTGRKQCDFDSSIQRPGTARWCFALNALIRCGSQCAATIRCEKFFGLCRDVSVQRRPRGRVPARTPQRPHYQEL